MWIAYLVLPSRRRRTRGKGRRTAWGLVRSGGEDGFSIVEIMVAMALFALVATFMASMLAGGLRGVLNGKRRQVATQEANRIVEIARSLSFDAIGLVETDPTLDTDASVQTQGGQRGYTSGGLWEPLVWAINPSGHPFNPHVQALQRGSTRLTRSVYVTSADAGTNLKRITVHVGWDNSGTPGPANEVRLQTLVNKGGVITTTSGDSTTPLTGTTLVSGGNLSIQSSLLGLSVPATINLPNSAGGTSYRAVSDARCTTRSAAVSILDILDLPGESVTVTADDDARTATPAEPSPQSKSTVLGIPAGSLQSLIGSSIGSPISCAASAVPMASENGSASLAGTINAQTNLSALSGLLNWLFTVASVQTQPMSQSLLQEIVSGQREVVAQSSAATGMVQLLKLPVIPDGLVRVDALSYGATVRGAAGTPSAAPSLTTPSFTLRIFDNGSRLGSGCTTGIAGPGVSASRSGSYCQITVNPAAAGFQGFSLQISGGLTQNILNLLGLLEGTANLSFTTSVQVLPPTKTPIAGETGPNGERRWSAEYSPINVTASLNATVLPLLGSGVPLIDSTVGLNLGVVRSEACAGATCT